jgi:hypothetical protein
MKTSLYKYFLLASLFVFAGCGSALSPKTDLEPYGERFVEEGRKRGITVDLAQKGITFSFKDIADKAEQGYCLNNDIFIDKTAWRSLAGKDNKKELLMFHELGHCYLRRGHTQAMLPNSEPISLMSNEGSIIYRGLRTKYYIDELFDENTPVPDWGKANQKDKAILNKKLLYREDFKTINQSDLLFIVKPIATAFTPQGLKLTTDIKTSASLTTKKILEVLSQNKDLENYEVELNFEFGNISSDGVLFDFYADENGNKQSHFLGSRLMSINKASFFPADYIYSGDLKAQSTTQVVKIRRLGNLVYLIINDTIVNYYDILPNDKPTINYQGYDIKWHFTFGPTGNTTVTIPDISIYSLTP